MASKSGPWPPTPTHDHLWMCSVATHGHLQPPDGGMDGLREGRRER